MMDGGSFFSSNYAEARDRYQRAAEHAGATLTSIPIAAPGPQGERLTIDIAWCGATDADHAVVHTSGLHGVEGFAGSAIQTAWLERQSRERIAPSVAIVFVHAANPYGMAWLRRADENNVDLNRNWLDRDDEYRGAPDGYADVDRFLNDTRPSAAGFYVGALRLIARHGLSASKHLVASGQYVNPRGLFFGGSQREETPAHL